RGRRRLRRGVRDAHGGGGPVLAAVAGGVARARGAAERGVPPRRRLAATGRPAEGVLQLPQQPRHALQEPPAAGVAPRVAGPARPRRSRGGARARGREPRRGRRHPPRLRRRPPPLPPLRRRPPHRRRGRRPPALPRRRRLRLLRARPAALPRPPPAPFPPPV